MINLLSEAMPHKINVLLIYPPLVESSFGMYYPSLAVLAAHLVERGYSVQQSDFNAEFAEALLDEELLVSIGKGAYPERHIAVESRAAVAARILLRERHKLLVAPLGKHNFRDSAMLRVAGHGDVEETPAYLVADIASLFRISDLQDRPRSEGVSSVVLGLYNRVYDGAIQKLERTTAPNVIGISVAMGAQIIPSLIAARRLRAEFPEVRIVLGGPALSLLPKECLDDMLRANPEVNAICLYEGEVALENICEQVCQGVWLPAMIPGLVYLDDEGVHAATPQRGLALNLLRTPLYDGRIVRRLAVPSLSVIQARGCYWGRCAYCDFIELYKGSPRYRQRSASSLANDVNRLSSEHDVKEFSLITESLPPAYAKQFSRELLAKETCIRWSSFAMVTDAFDEDCFDVLAASGCTYLVVGMETMTSRVLKLVEKHSTMEMNVRFLERARRTRFPLVVNLIPDLPTTTYDEAMKSLDSITEHCDGLHYVSIFPFEATNSSRVGRRPTDYGLIPRSNDGDHVQRGQAQFDRNHLNAVDSAMTDHERARVHQAYFDFAEVINSKHLSQSKRNGTTKGYTIDRNAVDLVQSKGGLQVFAWRQRKAFSVPAKVGESIEVLGRKTGTELDEYLCRLPDPLVQTLRSWGMIVQL